MSSYLLFNSHSGNYSSQLKEIIYKKLCLMSVDVKSIDVYNQSYSIDSNCKLICVAGGDGTINNIVSKIINSNLQEQIKLIIVPFGSANIVANTLKINRSIVLKNWNKLKPTAIEVGRINDKIFLTAASLGTVSKVVNETNHKHKSILGFAGYLLNLLMNWHISDNKFFIDIDNRQIERLATSVTLSIGLNIVGFRPLLKKPDGLVDLYILKNRTSLGYLGVLYQFIFNKSGRWLEKHSGKKIICSTKEAVHFQIDGEKQPSTNTMSATIIGSINILK